MNSKLDNIDPSTLSEQEKKDLLLSLRRMGGKKGTNKLPAPTTDDELHNWILVELGYNIPRVAVCEDHQAPFDYVADYYFERESAILVIGGRESAKTLNTAIANYTMAENKSGCEICTFADIEAQSNKSYSYIKSFIYYDDSGKKTIKSSVEGQPLRKETLLKNGSKLEVIIGSLSGVNSPHPQKVHADEVDLQDKEIWQESQPVDIYIPTSNGQIRFGDLEIGDYVFGVDGRETRIVGIKDFDEKDIYKFDFTDGRSTESCIDHLWKIIMRRNKWGIFKTKELLSKYKVKDPRCNGFNYKYKIPQQSCVEYEKKNLKIHPYVLGVLLGDGTFRNTTISFRANDEDIANRVESLLPDEIFLGESISNDVSVFTLVHKGAGIRNPFRNIIEELELYKTDSFTKFIPLEYLESDFNDRLELLRGLMDTDGSFTKDSYFASVSYNLAIGVKELVQSMGGRALMRKKKTSRTGYSGGCGFIYEVSTTLPDNINPFWCPRKSNKFKNRIRTLNPSIRNIEYIGKKKARCITVDNDDGLYLTEEFIVTHNSRNMSSSKKFPDGRIIKAQDIATSTLKSTKGIVQEIVDETQKSLKEGLKPTWKIYKACVFEVAEEVSCCRETKKEDREARLIELNKDPNELCECDKVAKGEYAPGVPRKLDSICKGKFFKSRGWMAHTDVVRKFVQNTPNKWASQLECRRPMSDGLYLPTWSRERYCIRGYEPRPEFGYIWQGIDWGGSSDSTSAIVWIQGPLHQPIQVNNTVGTKTVIPQGAYVIFQEINESAMGATRLADKVVRQEIQYKNRYGAAWRVKSRFADKAGAQQRMDWREHTPPLPTKWYLSGSYFDPTVESVQALVSDSLLYADDQQCPGTCDDFESWRSKDGKEVHDSSSHNPAAIRYCLKNVKIISKRFQNTSNRQNLLPVAVGRDGAQNIPGAIAAVGVSSPQDGALYQSENWRNSWGPATANDLTGNRGGNEPWRP